MNRLKQRRCYDWLLVLVFMAAYTITFSNLAFDIHAGMRTHQSDLGQIDQAVWNSSRGRFLEFSKDDFLSTRLTDHVEPIFVLISPVFWLWDDVRALLLLQVLAAALGAIPLYALARGKLGISPALGLVLAYLLNPQLQSAILTEFHAIPLAVPLILWAFWAAFRHKWRAFAVALLLLTGVKEEAALLAAGIAAWACLRALITSPATRRVAALRTPAFVVPALMLILSLAWFAVATFVIVPAHAVNVYGSGQSVYFHRYGPLGDTPLDIFSSFFTRPGQVWAIATEPARMRYLFGLSLAFGFLPLLGLDILVFSLPLLLANLLSTYAAQYYGDLHYSAPLVPFFAMAAFVGMQRLRRHAPRVMPFATTLLIVGAILFYHDAGRGPLGGHYDPTPINAHHQLLHRFVDQLPPDAAVTATAAVHPHISHRRYAYKFPHGLQAAHPADWALIDVTGGTDMAPGDVKSTVLAMLEKDWGIVDAGDGFLLMRRGAPTKAIPAAFYDFARRPGRPDQSDPLRFVGLQVADWPRWRQTQIISHWQVGADYVPGSIRPWLEIRNLAGERLYTPDDLTPPALLWYPPTQWQPGDQITITTLPLSLPRTWGTVIAAVHGPDPFTPQHRLPAPLFLLDTTSLTPPDRSLALVGVYQRQADGRLQALPLDDLPQQAASDPSLATLSGRFRTAAGDTLSLQAWLPTQAAAGANIAVFSQWNQPLPDGVVAFMHLRQNDATIDQHDGPLQVFITLAADQPAWDWRQLTLPADSAPGTTLSVVLGLYHTDTGARLDVIDAQGNPLGNELRLGTITVAPPLIPDQACALIPATCASQP
ncbi:MAG: DUF2079 domain-containing protein [Chloroflexi bacterium]|nr:DUF2079 domain-containing protein [Chloroflexota bacterium]